ncbi:EamA family transporter RarD [Auritidibacter ignavus]|uniref:EamA family transporter RarD n=1 Tax=Auritidibacter TaxID=1160973 RepID=UPI000D731497|nr:MULTISPECIES: EamA family transporter RarD [Auritidibacter]AXR73939.1 EamA family transporter RarD [Auritidibacter sp. NML130574]WGH82649.1 EamA family transporter RarD [Auritidibacter ignavus]
MPRKATGAVALNYVVWGLLPLFWKLLDNVNSTYVLAHRIVWATVFSGIWLLIITITASRSGKTRPVFSGISARLIFSSIVIAANWGIYIWAVNGGFVSYAALGYFVAPLLSVLLGSIFFRESISGWQWAAILLTAGGALVYGWGHSGIGLLVVFGIAVTFSVYGAIKKTVKIDAVPGMFAESSILAPVAIVLLLAGVLTPGDSIGGSTWSLLVVSGLVTLVPLIVLSHYARSVPLSTLGMLQFILPVVQLALGVAMFDEVVSGLQALALLCIVTGVALYLFDGHRPRRQISNST